MAKQFDIAEVAHRLRPGANIVVHSDFCEPQYLLRQLADKADRFEAASVYSLMPMVEPPYVAQAAVKHLNLHTFFPGSGLRAAVNQGLVQISRTALSAIPALFDTGSISADLLLLQVSAPNANGDVSLGLSVDYMHAVIAQKPIIVAQINAHMPFTCGDTAVPLSLFDYVLAHDEPLPNLTPAAPDGVDSLIATHVASLIDDGDVLQTGIGALPDAVIAKLVHLKDLGLHTGIISAAWQPLIESGVVNNMRKSLFSGKSVATMAGGNAEFYQFLAGNTAIELHRCDSTHGIQTLARIERLCAVNSVLQIDLTGNANAEQVNGRIISTPGGLPDFARGARAAKAGKSIIALRSSFKQGAHSNIVAALAPDTPVSLEAAAIDFVVTEYGIAKISAVRGHARAKALIAIAHPDHRDSLSAACAAAYS